MRQQHPLRYSWKLKTGSSDKVLLTLAHAIEDTGYRLHKKPANPLSSSEVVGRKIIAAPKPKLMIIGVACLGGATALFWNAIPESINALAILQIIIGIILSVLGILMVIGSSKLYRLSLVGRIDQETYQTGAGMTESIVTARILGNRRPLWITFDRNRPQNDTKPRELAILEENFNELQFRLDSTLTALNRDR